MYRDLYGFIGVIGVYIVWLIGVLIGFIGVFIEFYLGFSDFRLCCCVNIAA